MTTPSVADVVAYESLPDETKRIAHAYWLANLDTLMESGDMADALAAKYAEGEVDGFAAGWSEAVDAHGLQERAA